MIAYVIPTRNRPKQLATTLAAIGGIPSEAHECIGGAVVVIADNASSPAASAPEVLANGVEVKMLRLSANEGASARNRCAAEARSLGAQWLVMLDDDSWPVDGGFVEDLHDAPAEVWAVCADIHLPSAPVDAALGRPPRESGGLPEVPTGCGVAVRTDAFLDAGGYDAGFGYYAEEYDLAAKLILRGGRIVHSARFRVAHAKDVQNRSMDTILRALVRNNGWVIQRYTPQGVLDWTLDHTIGRYRAIADKEGARSGFEAGLRELMETLDDQPRTPMCAEHYDRFTGLAAARAGLADLARREVCVVGEGKNAWAVRQALEECGAGLVGYSAAGEGTVLVPGTLSPGPMLDQADRLRGLHPRSRVVTAWGPLRAVEGSGAEKLG